MREELVGLRGRVAEVLLPRERHDERAHVRDDRQVVLLPQALQPDEVRMKPEGRPRAGHTDGEELGPGNGQGPPRRRVVGVAVDGDHHVVRVVAAEEEDTDQRLVVRRRGRRRQRVHDHEVARAGEDRGGRQRPTADLAEKISAGRRHVAYRSTRYCGEVTSR